MEIEIRVSFNAEDSNSTELMELSVDIITTWLKAYLREDWALLFSKPTTLKSIMEPLHFLPRIYSSGSFAK